METEDQNNQSLQLKYLELIRDVNEYSSIRLSLGHDDHRLNFSQSLTRYKVKKNQKYYLLFLAMNIKRKQFSLLKFKFNFIYFHL